jgi:hypothetical protein
MDRDRVVDLVKGLEDEVNNGGFHQYFNNSSGDDAAETISALQEIGALAMADILRRAIVRFPGRVPPTDRAARLEILRQRFPKTDEFDDLNVEFLAYPDDLSALLAQYESKLNST